MLPGRLVAMNGHRLGSLSICLLALTTGAIALQDSDAGGAAGHSAHRAAFDEVAPGSVVSFASKAFLCGAAARLAAEEGLHLDVASLGEQRIALAAGVDPKLLTLHGNFKTDVDLEAALDD